MSHTTIEQCVAHLNIIKLHHFATAFPVEVVDMNWKFQQLVALYTVWNRPVFRNCFDKELVLGKFRVHIYLYRFEKRFLTHCGKYLVLNHKVSTY